MTSEHLLSFDRVWRDEKWREIQASISLFKFLIMKVSLSLNGWTAWTLLKLALCSHSDLARSGVSLKTLRFKPDLPVIPLPWFSDLFSFAGELVIPDNANVYYALNSSMESLLFKLKKKADEKPSWGMFSSLFPCFIVKLRFTSIVSTSWIEEGQVLISENHWNGRWILSPLS